MPGSFRPWDVYRVNFPYSDVNFSQSRGAVVVVAVEHLSNGAEFAVCVKLTHSDIRELADRRIEVPSIKGLPTLDPKSSSDTSYAYIVEQHAKLGYGYAPIRYDEMGQRLGRISDDDRNALIDLIRARGSSRLNGFLDQALREGQDLGLV